MKKILFTSIFFAFVFISWTSKPSLSKKLNKTLKGNWAYIPAGKAKVDDKLQDVEEFYMLKTEVSNLNYHVFLQAIRNTEDYQKAFPDSEMWNSPYRKNEDFKNQNLTFPGFKNYPVVGVSYDAANRYCQWLEKTINAPLEASEKIKIRLPREAEWIRAARGDKHTSMFTWGSPYLKTRKGNYLANHKASEPVNSNLSVKTTDIYSFYKNEFGVYQMNGNVSEMTDEPTTVKGGSWNSEAKALEIDNKQFVDLPNKEVGFRPILKVLVQ
jgi:formylglycine-generating enzyme required for sulfatase activity